MSCPDGSCFEPQKRTRALIMLGLMMLVFIMLSAFSFISEHKQVTPDQVSFDKHQATDGKRVFQAYNCMGCHTVVGNGAYFAPDLTKEYANAGPAWITAFLGAAATWPTEGAVKSMLLMPHIAADSGVKTIEEYYAKYPGAKERIERRGGKTTYMPNLLFNGDEIPQLVAFMKYTSAMDTEGWPPEVKVKDLDKRIALAQGGHSAPLRSGSKPAAESASTAGAPAAGGDLAERGKTISASLGCVACHAPGTDKLVGPGWGKLHGAQVKLADGSTVTADDAYLIESILKPNEKIVEGFPPSVMPPYEAIVSEDDAKAIVEYIKTLN